MHKSCLKVKVLVTQLCPMLCDPMYCHPPSSSVGFAIREYWSRLPFPSPGDLPNPRIEPRYPTFLEDSFPAEPQWKPKNTGVGSLSLLQRIFPTQESNRGPCIAGGFFTNWAMREALLLLVWISFTSLLVVSRFWLLTWFYLDQILFTQLHRAFGLLVWDSCLSLLLYINKS